MTATDTATGTITNDDTAPVLPATVTIGDASAEEGDALTFTVTLDNAVDGGFTVTPALHRRHRDPRHRLHGEHDRAQLHRHRGRDADLHRGDDRGRGTWKPTRPLR